MLYSKNGSYPSRLPFRITLSNGFTRTDPTSFTEEEIADAGYIAVDDPPVYSSHQILIWTGTNWLVRDKNEQELAEELARKWYEVRAHRDRLLSELDWKVMRYNSQVRLGITPIDDINSLDVYAQALRDVTLQSDPDGIVWPSSPF